MISLKEYNGAALPNQNPKGALTFITAFYSPIENQFKSTEFYFEMFEHMASSSVNIMLYLDDRYSEKGKELIEKYKNVRIEYKNFILLKKELIDFDIDFILPTTRNIKKDTLEYFFIQLSKLYHLSLYSSNKENKDTHIAWIDFGIFYLFKEKEKSKTLLKTLSTSKLPKDVVLAPGCWPINYFNKYKDYLFNMVSWFFCGSFMIGDINLFGTLYKEQMKIVYNNLPRITWEVNYWALIQNNLKDKLIIIEDCDHDDLLLEKTFEYINNLN
jgi:hypothetical protein